MDLLHFLLEKRAGATIVKFPSSDDTDNVIAGLKVLTKILKKLKNGKCERRVFFWKYIATSKNSIDKLIVSWDAYTIHI